MLATAPSASSADLERRLADEAASAGVPEWALWLAAILPAYCTHPFGPHHRTFWEWLWAIEPGVRPPAMVALWARGGAKSTTAEGACVALGARGKRRYGLYVCDTQDRADDHVGNVASMLESERVELFYPELSERRLGKHGNSRGWRRNRVWTSAGFVLDAIGLDTAARGVKLEDQRPDFLVVDDIDSPLDSSQATARKVTTLTKSLIPAGAEDLAVVAIQNLIHPSGVFARLADGRADFLTRRIVSGPVPALEDMTVDADGVVHGRPTWAGQSLERCREMVADMGLRAFLAECQHDVKRVDGALWTPELIDGTRRSVFPDLSRLVVAIDPAVTSGQDSDESGIIAVGRSGEHAYVLEDHSVRADPHTVAARAVAAYHDLGADRLVVEDNNGADWIPALICTVDPNVKVDKVHASRGKALRAQPVAGLYEQGRVHHVGVLGLLEEQMCSWTPEAPKSPDRLDALVWGVTALFPELGAQRRRGGLAA